VHRLRGAILLVSLAACAAAPVRWQRAETSRETADRDLADCRMKTPPAMASVATPVGTQNPGQRHGAEVMQEMREVELCMRFKGYSPGR
jgi:hypothetical protein